MTESMAILYVSKRAEELGYENFALRYRDFNIRSPYVETIEIKTTDEFYVVVRTSPGILIESDAGFYDIRSEGQNLENSHEHTGTIKITTDPSQVTDPSRPLSLRMVQVMRRGRKVIGERKQDI